MNLLEWTEERRKDEGKPLPDETRKRLAAKRCPNCGSADTRVNAQAIYVCCSCVYQMSPRHGVMLWWKFDPDRESDNPTWVHGTRVARAGTEGGWEPRDDGPWETPKRRGSK